MAETAVALVAEIVVEEVAIAEGLVVQETEHGVKSLCTRRLVQVVASRVKSHSDQMAQSPYSVVNVLERPRQMTEMAQNEEFVFQKIAHVATLTLHDESKVQVLI